MTEDLSNRNQSIDSLCKSMDWFLYDKDLRYEELTKCRKLPVGVLKHLVKLTGKHLYGSVTLLEQGDDSRCFPRNLTKVFRASLLFETSDVFRTL